MKCLKVAAAAVNQTPLDWDGNFENILEAIRQAREKNVAILCLPELCITGYGCEDRFQSIEVLQRALETLIKITRETTGMVVCVGLPVMYRNAIYNTIAVIVNTVLVGFVAKQHLAGDGLHYEPRWFKPWPAGRQTTLSFETEERDLIGVFDHHRPFGDLQFDVDGMRIGFEICEDAWVAERPGSHLARKGVDLILNPSASHFAFGKHEIRKRFVIEGSRAFSATYVYANLLGNEAGRALYDGECLIATGGTLVAQSHRFSMRAVELLTAVVDLDATRTQQASTSSFTPEYEDDAKSWAVGCGIHYTEEPVTQFKSTEPDLDPIREFSSVLPLALFDYMRKSRSKGFVISLSGGADSAACAILVRTMVDLGVYHLGIEEFSKRLGLQDTTLRDVREIMKGLLTCVYQSTENSSKTTLEAARTIAQDIGSKFCVIDVDSLVKDYTSKVSTAIRRDLSWETDDIALQNIQARVRAPSVWLIANLENKLLITTSNRSEAAVGYCTMDGDTAGSIAPIGGIDKHFLLKWLAFVQTKYHALEHALELILCQRPTAELRPGSNQTDEDDLMPYEILEFIEDRAILEKKGPREVFRCLKQYKLMTGDHTAPELALGATLSSRRAFAYVEKFFQLWCRNQWKRERYALSFHVDDKNLDPRSWCRFPVLSGGFQKELRELRAELKLDSAPIPQGADISEVRALLEVESSRQ